jgi:hypothetical protein
MCDAGQLQGLSTRGSPSKRRAQAGRKVSRAREPGSGGSGLGLGLGIARSHEADFARHLTKPFDMEDLEKVTAPAGGPLIVA